MQHDHGLRHFASRGIEWIYLGALALLAALLAQNQYLIVTTPIPLDYYEGAMPLLTGLIAKGHNPYTLGFQPAFADVYPPLYNLIVAPLSLVFGNTLQLHRLVNAVLIALSCGLLAAGARHGGARRADCLCVALLLYGALLFYNSPVASTNATGEFFFLASVLLPWMDRWRWRGLATSIICAVLAFYSKQYFLLGLGLVAAHLFLAVSKRRALAYAAIGVALLLASLVAVHLSSPYFLDNTVFSVRNAVGMIRSTDVLLRQLARFGMTYPGILLLAMLGAITAALAWHHRGGRFSETFDLQLRPFDAPLLRSAPGCALTYFAGATVAVVSALGLNPGNYMTYLFQLMSPFLLLGVFTMPMLRGARRALLLPLAWYSLFAAWWSLPRDFSADMEQWQHVNEVIAESEEILASPILLMSLIEQGKRVYQNGHTFYFRFAEPKPAFLQPADPERRVPAIWRSFIEDLYQRVEARKFDVVLVTNWDLVGIFAGNPPPGRNIDGLEYFKRYYEMTESLQIPLTDRDQDGLSSHNLQVWRPRITAPSAQ